MHRALLISIAWLLASCSQSAAPAEDVSVPDRTRLNDAPHDIRRDLSHDTSDRPPWTAKWRATPNGISSGKTASLRGVWGTSASDVWAVGANTILHWNGTSWSESKIEPACGSPWLTGVWGSSSSDVWATADGRASGAFGYPSAGVLHWDAATWTENRPCCRAPRPGDPGRTDRLFGVWGSGASDVWAFGVDILLHWNGKTWSPAAIKIPAATTPCNDGIIKLALSGVWGSSASDVWAISREVCEGGPSAYGCACPLSGSPYIFHWDGTAWSGTTGVVKKGLNSVWGNSATDIWAVGDEGTIFHWNGILGETVPSGTKDNLNGVWGSSASDVWAVGGYPPGGNSNGSIHHWNGATWSSIRIGTSVLNSVWGSSAADVWAVGEDGTILHYSP